MPNGDYDDVKPVLSGQVLGPETGPDRQAGLQMPLHFPPGVKGMGLGHALLGQVPYWGLKRSIDAYRLAVESGVAAVRVVREYHVEMRELEAEKERWANRQTYRDAAKLEAQILFENVKAAKNLAIAARMDSEMTVQAANDRLEAAEVIRVIQKNNLEADRIRSERMVQEEREGLSGQGDFKKKLRNLEQSKKDYVDLMAAKAADIEEHGGEEKLPEFLATMYERLEEQLLGMGKR